MLFEAIGIQKTYDGVKALKGVSLDLQIGEVHALVGENGAGKSTLIKILTGAVQPDTGEIRLRGNRIEHMHPAKSRELGIAAIYQQPALFPDLTVSENIAISNDGNKLWRKVDWKVRRSNAAAANPSVLIMDEPSASLGERDAENLFRIVIELRASGTGILYISHRLEELFHIADRVTVLRDGNTVGTGEMAGVTARELIRMMVGRDLDGLFPKKVVALGKVALQLREVSCKQLKIKNVSLTIRRGEILGLAGLVGSGRTQLAEALFGLMPITGGEVFVDGQVLDIRSPVEAVHAGLAYVPEDRCRHGVILEMPISMNMTLASLDKVSKHGLLQMKAEHDHAREFQDRLQVRAPSINALAKSLSGGNQQKVALARWLMTKPKILILDEPTQGIDVHAKSEIYRLIGELAESGLAILLISSDMLEILAMCDRIAVMAKGELVGILEGKDASPDEVLGLALGHKRAAPGRLN